MSTPIITTWHSSDGKQILIKDLALSQLINSIRYLKGMPPQMDFSGKKYPRGTTASVLLKVLEEEKINRKLRQNSKLFE